LETTLFKNNFIEIDQIFGLKYIDYSNILKNKNSKSPSYKSTINFQRILTIDSLNELPKWVDVYCLAFDLLDKRYIVYDILKKNFNYFYFMLSKTMGSGDQIKDELPVSCCLLYPYRDALGLYCLGTIEEYRHRNIGSNLLENCIFMTLNYNCRYFTIQTLKSDNLLPYYIRRGFVLAYTNKVFKLLER
jgi:hypothetical protein